MDAYAPAPKQPEGSASAEKAPDAKGQSHEQPTSVNQTPQPQAATQPQTTHPAAQVQRPPEPKEPGLMGELWGKRRYILKAFAVLVVFWLLEFSYQYYFLNSQELESSLVRSFALGGATLIGVALAIGPLTVLSPRRNYNDYRRTVGVSGFTLISLHVLSVIKFLYDSDATLLFWSLNPYKNPVIFGVGAFIMFAVIFSTSTDWAVGKLGYKKWKTVHRLVYFAYLAAILHFTQINPPLLYNPAGYLLMLVTFAALALELAAFAKKVKSKQKLSKGAWVGFGIIALYTVLLALDFFFRKLVA